MARSIRFWGLAAKLITETSGKVGTQKSELRPTQTGNNLFGKHGWDPYIEDPGTLWLLHWMILAPPSRVPVWWAVFNRPGLVEFSDTDLDALVTSQLELTDGWKTPSLTSIKKDVRVMLRTYTMTKQTGRTKIDDMLDCPFRELNLIRESPYTPSKYRFTLGSKPSLPSEIVAYACLDWLSRSRKGGDTATFSRLASEPGSPGRVFRLTDKELETAVRPAASNSSLMDVVTLTSATQLVWKGDPKLVAVETLNRYYGSNN